MTGTGFTQVTAVRFGGATGSSVHVVSATLLAVTSLRHAAGIVNMQVVTSHGASKLTTADRLRFS